MKKTNSINGKINRTPVDKLSRNITSEKKLKKFVYFNWTILKFAYENYLKYIPKNNNNLQKFNNNKLSGNNPPSQKYNKSFLKKAY